MEMLIKYAKIVDEICERTSNPGKKMVQKLMYLIERKGVNLDLNYSIHYYGPYSSKLDNAIHSLEGKSVLKIDTSGRTHVISMIENIDEDLIDDAENKTINYVLDKFINKSPLELEAITTLDYVANTLLVGKQSDRDILMGVKKIKGSKYSLEYLEKELNILKELEYLC